MAALMLMPTVLWIPVDYNKIEFEFTQAIGIGQGGSCKVLKTETYGLPCAVKVLSIDTDGWEEQQFTAEVELLTRVHHPNLCRLYAASSSNGPQKYLVLELLDIPLDTRLVEGPPLSWQQRIWIGCCVTRALNHSTCTHYHLPWSTEM
jgi:serine/threonine protein kinase